MKTRITALLVCITFTACGSKPVLDVGEETRTTGAALSDYAADWDGYAEAFQVSGDGTDRVRIVLDDEGGGTIRFGEEGLVAAASDPNGIYPPPWVYNHNGAGVQSGFEYPIVNARVTSARLEFAFESSIIDDSWCALQPLESERGFDCNAGGSFSTDPDTGNRVDCKVDTPQGPMSVDCEAYSACRRCDCDATSCVAKPRGTLSVDAALSNDGNSLTGTMVLVNGERITLRLNR